MPDGTPSPWNSLEVARLAADLLIPLAIAWVGFAVQSKLSMKDRTAEMRSEVYDSIGDALNRIYCFIADFGTFADESPDSLIGYKRLIDRKMYSRQAIWPNDTFAAFEDYMKSAFKVHGPKVGQPAQIRACNSSEKQNVNSNWKNNQNWIGALTDEIDGSEDQKYKALVRLLNRDLIGS